LRKFNNRVLHKGIVATIAVAGLIVGAAAPGFAGAPDPTVGTGAGTGWELPQPANPTPCGPVPILGGVELTSDQFDLSYDGTVVSAPADTGLPVAAYLGPVLMTIKVGDHIAGPLAVYGGGNCGTASESSTFPVPGTIAIQSVAVTGSTPAGGGVSCTGGAGSGIYTRVSSAAAFTFTASCTIAGVPPTGAVTTAFSATFVISGTMNPCVLVPPIGFPTNPECDALGQPANAGSHVVTSYQQVAVSP
jgi:hypothetical protein